LSYVAFVRPAPANSRRAAVVHLEVNVFELDSAFELDFTGAYGQNAARGSQILAMASMF
jgi:hypothetical protein